jgi:hypothetical protein
MGLGNRIEVLSTNLSPTIPTAIMPEMSLKKFRRLLFMSFPSGIE